MPWKLRAAVLWLCTSCALPSIYILQCIIYSYAITKKSSAIYAPVSFTMKFNAYNYNYVLLHAVKLAIVAVVIINAPWNDEYNFTAQNNSVLLRL